MGAETLPLGPDDKVNMDVDDDGAPQAKVVKGDIDQAKVQADIVALKSLAKSGQQQQAIDGLLAIEKTGRVGEDISSTQLACTAILEVLHEASDWKGLQEYIALLSKRRGQLKQAVQAMVRQCMGYTAAAPADIKVEFIKTLQAITEGKIFVEIERARLTRELAHMKEAEGNVAEAAEILQEVAVETFGAMAKTEKVAFILEQVRLCLARQDYVRAQILARKVSPRAFNAPPPGGKRGEGTGEVGIEGTAMEAPAPGTPSLEQLKLQYYGLMVQYHAHEANYLEMCRSYRAILDTPSVAEDPVQWGDALKKAAWYAALSPADSDQRTLLAATVGDRRLVNELPQYAALLGKISGKEVVWWQHLSEEYAAEMDAQPEVFGGEHGTKRREDLQARVIEHNISVISGFYSRISIPRLAQMLDLPAEEAERRLCDMVTGRGLAAKVDRPAGIVRFGGRATPGQALNRWSTSIGKLLVLVEKTCQQIQKESMVHSTQRAA